MPDVCKTPSISQAIISRISGDLLFIFQDIITQNVTTLPENNQSCQEAPIYVLTYSARCLVFYGVFIHGWF